MQYDKRVKIFGMHLKKLREERNLTLSYANYEGGPKVWYNSIAFQQVRHYIFGFHCDCVFEDEPLLTVSKGTYSLRKFYHHDKIIG